MGILCKKQPAAIFEKPEPIARNRGKCGLPRREDSGSTAPHPAWGITAVEEELQAYGLDEPALTITVNYTAEGADGEDVPDILVLHVSPDTEAEKEAGEGADGAQDGAVYSLTAEKDGGEQVWLFQGEEFEITGLWDSLTALTAEEFTGEEPEQKEEIRLTVYLDNENFPEVQIALYRYGGTRCLAAADGESVSLVERAAVVDLIEAVHAIVLH